MDNVVTIKDTFDGIDGLYVSARYSERDIDINSKNIEGLHMHDCYEIYMNVDGKVSFVVEDKVYDITRGDIIVTRPNEFHYCLFKKNIRHKCYCIWIFPKANSALANILYSKISGSNNFLPSAKEDISFRLNLFSKICNKEGDSIHKLSNVMQILDMILSGCQGSKNFGNKIPDNIQEIIDYININFNVINSLTDIYDRFYISSSTLNRYFYKYLKTTPAKFIENKRLANAKNILLSGGSVMQASEDSGFPDYSHFIKLFREKFGVTPGKYYKNGQ